jgi:hypothetical protein
LLLDQSKTRYPKLLDILSPYLPHFQSLERIGVYGFNLKLGPPREDVINVLKNLTELEILGLCCGTREFIEVISSLSLLQVLTVAYNGPLADFNSLPKDQNLPPPPRLRSLDFTYIPSSILRWLISHTQTLPLASLALRGLISSRIPFVQDLLRLLGPSLHHFVLEFTLIFDGLAEVSLAHNTELRTFTVYNLIGQSKDAIPMPAVTRTLSSIASLHLAQLNFGIPFDIIYPEEELFSWSERTWHNWDEARWNERNQTDWALLSRTLARQPQFSNLDSVHFCLDNDSYSRSEEQWYSWIRRAIPDCDSRGILRFSSPQNSNCGWERGYRRLHAGRFALPSSFSSKINSVRKWYQYGLNRPSCIELSENRVCAS